MSGDRLDGAATYTTVERILARQMAETEAVTKAADEPWTLTDDDLKILPGEIVAKLMTRGALAHLGLGAARRGRRHR